MCSSPRLVSRLLPYFLCFLPILSYVVLARFLFLFRFMFLSLPRLSSPLHSTPSALSIQIVELAVCAGLTRLDLSKNKLTSLDGVAMNTALRWLSVAGNAIDSADALKDLEHLEVLNLGRNQLAGKVAVGRLRALKALIANDNQITLVGGECLAWPWQLQLRRLLALSAVV